MHCGSGRGHLPPLERDQPMGGAAMKIYAASTFQSNRLLRSPSIRCVFR